MVNKMTADNERMSSLLANMQADSAKGLEKINWFEKKLNKWIESFQGEVEVNTNNFNTLVSKINEVDKGQTKALVKLENKLDKLAKGGLGKGALDRKGTKKRDVSLEDLDDDDISQKGRQMKKRLTMRKPGASRGP
jgi:hypothetical protein